MLEGSVAWPLAGKPLEVVVCLLGMKTSRSFLGLIEKIIKIIVPIAISVGLVLWLFHKVDFHRVEAIMRHGVDYRYLVVMMLLTMCSFIIRGIRWGIQLRAVGIPRMTAMAESVSIFSAYALNLVFPFLGEAWRCVYVSRREGVKLSSVVGTDLGDRASDGVMIGLIILLAFFVANPALTRFLDKYPMGEALHRYATDWVLWVSVVVILSVAVGLLYYFRQTAPVERFLNSASRLWNGFAVLFTMKQKGLYLVLTLGIWACYFLETYSCFYAFPFTRQLIEQPGMAMGLIPGLVVFVFGSCSMIVPSNGGLGPWNIAVMFALTIFGVSATDGTAYSVACWSFQTAMIVALGIFSAFYIMLTRKSTPGYKKREQAR